MIYSQFNKVYVIGWLNIVGLVAKLANPGLSLAQLSASLFILLNEVSLGYQYVEIGLILRETILLSKMLLSSEAWHKVLPNRNRHFFLQTVVQLSLKNWDRILLQ